MKLILRGPINYRRLVQVMGCRTDNIPEPTMTKFLDGLTYWGLDKMDTSLQTTYLNAFYWKNICTLIKID